eukprot:46345-Eustigmatos_ZCMA.PRE.1
MAVARQNSETPFAAHPLAPARQQICSSICESHIDTSTLQKEIVLLRSHECQGYQAARAIEA